MRESDSRNVTARVTPGWLDRKVPVTRVSVSVGNQPSPFTRMLGRTVACLGLTGSFPCWRRLIHNYQEEISALENFAA